MTMETPMTLFEDEENGQTQMEVIPQGFDVAGISFMTINGSVLLKENQLLELRELIGVYLNKCRASCTLIEE